MEHLSVFIFFMLFMLSLFSFVLSAISYSKTKKQLLKYFMFFFLVISIKLLLYNFLLYIKVNVIFETTFQLLLLTMNMDISFITIIFFPILLHNILAVPYRSSGNTVFGILLFFVISARLLPYFSKIFFNDITVYFSISPVQNIILFLALLYCFGIIIYYFRKVRGNEIKKLILMISAFLLFLFLDNSYISEKIYLSSFYSVMFWVNILFYLIWNIFFITFVIRFFNFDNAVLTDIKLNEDFLKKYGITAREREILLIMIQGKSNREIAEKYFISLKTVKNHIYSIYQKTGAKNRIELAFQIKNQP